MPKKAAAPAQAQETAVSAPLPMEYDVRIQSLKMSGNSRATASVNINGGFAVRGVSVMEGKNGLFVSMPSAKLENGEYLDHCFPCTKESRATFDKAVLDAYQQAVTHGLNGQEQQNPAQLPLEYTVKIQSLRLGSGALKGTASVNLNDQFAIRRVSIMESGKGLFVSMPGFKGFKGYQDYCFPCTKESFAQFQSTVLDAYQQALTQSQEAGQDMASGQQMAAPDPFAAQQQGAPVMRM